ncbi:MAG: amidohydrolase [Anaerolineae bacterium]|nr:amidohydrolase [Anaerolineae bacterium]
MSKLMINTILYNARIVTLDERHPHGTVTALAIRDGKIAALGSDSEILPLATVGTKKHDLHGLVVIPGLIDAHVHWKWTAESLHQVQLYGTRNIREAVDRVAAMAAKLPPGEWVQGYGWSQDTWEEHRFPTTADLDALVPDRPVFLRSRSGHAAWVNSLALRLCGIDASTPDVVEAEIQRDATGEPTGILIEWNAMNLVADRIPTPTTAQTADQMRKAQGMAHSMGVTGIHDFDNQDCLAALQVMRERGELGLRVLKQINKGFLDSLLHMGLRTGFGDNWLRLGNLKLFADGAIGAHSAYMFEPYIGEPDNYGIVVVGKEEMLELASRASTHGFATTIHAIGDRAVHDVLDVFEHVRGEELARGIPRSTRRHRIEHVQVIHPSDVDRLAELTIIASTQPIHATSDYPIADAVWGADRCAYAYNPRLQLDRGVTVCFGSDSPCDEFGALKGIHAAVTRRRPDGTPGPEGWYPQAKVSVDEALKAYTVGAAYAAGLEGIQGKLAPGYLADLAVIDRDLYAIPGDEILDVNVCGTMVDGGWRYGEWMG